MSNLRKAAKQALIHCEKWPAYGGQEIADTLRAALAEPEQSEPVGVLLEEAYGRGQVLWYKKPADGTRLYTTAPQRREPEQGEMTAMVDAAMVEMKNIHPPLRRSECQRLVSAAIQVVAPPAQTPVEPEQSEPVAFVKENPYCPEGLSDELSTYLPVGMELYAAPPRQVPLTRPQIRDLIMTHCRELQEAAWADSTALIRAVEAHHGILGDDS